MPLEPGAAFGPYTARRPGVAATDRVRRRPNKYGRTLDQAFTVTGRLSLRPVAQRSSRDCQFSITTIGAAAIAPCTGTLAMMLPSDMTTYGMKPVQLV